MFLSPQLLPPDHPGAPHMALHGMVCLLLSRSLSTESFSQWHWPLLGTQSPPQIKIPRVQMSQSLPVGAHSVLKGTDIKQIMRN